MHSEKIISMMNIFNDAKSHEYFMIEALKEANKALLMDEVPVGAIIVCENKIIARGHNMTQRLNDVTAHAEMIAITAAANYLSSKYLDQCTLYVTLEPCVMCAGACGWAQLKEVIYGAADPKRGFRTFSPQALHPVTKITVGVYEEQCSRMIKDYFISKRKDL
jgi:tRNA(adenine34) deaminase